MDFVTDDKEKTLFSEDYIASVRKRANAAALNHTHEQPWIPEYRKAVAAYAAVVPFEVPGFCPRCNAGLCVRCAKCHLIYPLTGKPCPAFEKSDPECGEWKEAYILIQAIIDEDLEHDQSVVTDVTERDVKISRDSTHFSE